VNESDGTATLTVTLSSAASGVVTVDYATSDGTAVAGTDYTTASGTVTFQPGVTSQTITVGIIDNDSYTDQTVYFTTALSNPSNATLGMPSDCTVNIKDDDPVPTIDITIAGVPRAQQNNPGGYVAVNANNDNGSNLTYADGKTVVPVGTYGIPTMRDFDPKNVKLAAADPDLLLLTISTLGLKAGGPETIVLSVTSAGRAKVQLWDTATKNNQIASPTTWTLATLPLGGAFYVEGLLEGAALMEITVKVQIQLNGAPVATDTCVLTVTPVLTNLLVTATAGWAPDIVNSPGLGWFIDTRPAGMKGNSFTVDASAQWNNVRGDLKFVQTASFANNLAKPFGASITTVPVTNLTFDFGAPYAGTALNDGNPKTIPFYTTGEKLAVAGGVATNQIRDTPRLPLTNFVPGGQSALPGVGQTTTIDVNYNYVTYGTVAFTGPLVTDKCIYCLGQQSWNAHYAGAVTQPPPAACTPTTPSSASTRTTPADRSAPAFATMPTRRPLVRLVATRLGGAGVEMRRRSWAAPAVGCREFGSFRGLGRDSVPEIGRTDWWLNKRRFS